MRLVLSSLSWPQRNQRQTKESTAWKCISRWLTRRIRFRNCFYGGIPDEVFLVLYFPLKPVVILLVIVICSELPHLSCDCFISSLNYMYTRRSSIILHLIKPPIFTHEWAVQHLLITAICCMHKCKAHSDRSLSRSLRILRNIAVNSTENESEILWSVD